MMVYELPEGVENGNASPPALYVASYDVALLGLLGLLMLLLQACMHARHARNAYMEEEEVSCGGPRFWAWWRWWERRQEG